jgi:LysR family nitrogen assimilation transcriptional regulator
MTQSPLQLRQLRYFMAVAQAGSFAAASRQLNVSQPALGYQVKKLEELLGVELLVRTSRGIALTAAGSELVSHGQAIEQRLREAIVAMSAYRARPMRNYSFGATPTPGKALVPDLLEAFAGTGESITIREGLSVELFKQVRSGDLDIAVCYDPPSNPDVTAVPLYREDLFLVGPAALIDENHKPVEFAELQNYPLVLDTGFQLTRGLIERLARERDVRLNVVLEVEPASFKRELLISNRCCTVVPFGLFLHEISTGELRSRHIVSPSIDRTLTLIVRPGFPSADLEHIQATLVAIVMRKIAEGRLGWRAI